MSQESSAVTKAVVYFLLCLCSQKSIRECLHLLQQVRRPDPDHLRVGLLRHPGGQPMVGPVREHPLAGLSLPLGVDLHPGSRRARAADEENHRAVSQPGLHPVSAADMPPGQEEVPNPRTSG